MKRIQKGPVRGISFRLQEEERERKDQYVQFSLYHHTQTNFRYVPDVSALSSEDPLEIDAETKDLLKSLGMDNIPVNVTNVTSFAPKEKKGRYVPGSGRN